MIPALTTGSLSLSGRKNLHHIAGSRRVVPYRSGRIAIANALRLAKVQAGDEVLVPAYHCPSIVEPVEAVGATPVFYRITEDLQPDLDDLLKKMTTNVKSVIAVHIFGLLADLNGLRSICDGAGISLIEDCAHCFSYSRTASTFGATGDFVITSPRKFMPTFDGGELIVNKDDVMPGSPESANLLYQMKIAKNILETAYLTKRSAAGAFADMSRAARQVKQLSSVHEAPEFLRPDSGSNEYTDPRFSFDHVNARQSLIGSFLPRVLAIDEVIRRRRRNFRILQACCDGLSKARILPAPQERHESPYVFPLMVDGGDRTYALLQRFGTPMWRWDEIRQSDCQTSLSYSRHVIQFPCHQGISRDQAERLGNVIRDLLA